MARSKALAPVEEIGRTILILRRQRIILDADLAALYGVTTKRLIEQVKRNAERFPADFMFHLTRAEVEALNRDPRFPSFAFTEHGAIMAATIVNSPKAVEMSLYVVRAFVRLRELLASNTALARKLDELERKYQHHDEINLSVVFAGQNVGVKEVSDKI